MLVTILAAMLELNNWRCLRIVIAAITNKVAAQLSNDLRVTVQQLGLNKYLKESLPQEVVTLYHLLGLQFQRQRMRYHDTQTQIDNSLH